mmetsp:Transcript_22403/g.36026  ORF Transcript_22403/g.36026 Transcript_22403/m.36026 type:complete len:273 (+) Transcript_22403:1929-2747(+)
MRLDCFGNGLGDRFDILRAVDHVEPGFEFLCQCQKPCAHFGLQLGAEVFEPFFGPLAALGACQPFGGIHVDQKCDVRLAADHQVMQGVNGCPQVAPAEPLIHPCAIGKAVADHDLALCQRRKDQPFHVVAPCCCEQQQFCFCGPTVGITLQDQRADFFGPGRASGFAGEHHIVAFVHKVIGQHPGLGGFARAVDPFKTDEGACAHAPPSGVGPLLIWLINDMAAVEMRARKPPCATSVSATNSKRCSGNPSGCKTNSARGVPAAIGAWIGPL